MKTLILFVFTFSYCFGFGQSNPSQNLTEYDQKIILKSIPTCIGEVSTFPKDSARAVSNDMNSDTLRFLNAQVGYIQHCSCSYIAQNGKYLQILLEINDDLTFNQTLHQAKRQFGDPEKIIAGDMEIYKWKYTQLNKILVNVEIKYFTNKASGTLILTKSD